MFSSPVNAELQRRPAAEVTVLMMSHPVQHPGARGYAPARSLLQHNAHHERQALSSTWVICFPCQKSQVPKGCFSCQHVFKIPKAVKADKLTRTVELDNLSSPSSQTWSQGCSSGLHSSHHTMELRDLQEQLQHQLLTVLPLDSSSTPCTEAALPESHELPLSECLPPSPAVPSIPNDCTHTPTSNVLIPWGFCLTGVDYRKKGSSTIDINLIIPDAASPHSTQPPLHCLSSRATGTSQPLIPKQAQENHTVTDTKVLASTKNFSSSIFSFGLCLPLS